MRYPLLLALLLVLPGCDKGDESCGGALPPGPEAAVVDCAGNPGSTTKTICQGGFAVDVCERPAGILTTACDVTGGCIQACPLAAMSTSGKVTCCEPGSPTDPCSATVP